MKPTCPKCGKEIIPEEPRPGCAGWNLHAETKSYECSTPAQSEATGTPATYGNAMALVSTLRRELSQVTASRDKLSDLLTEAVRIIERCHPNWRANQSRLDFNEFLFEARAALSQKEKS